MTLKATINKEEYDKLVDPIKFEYEADGDNYKLKVDGLEDAAELRRARDREKQEAADAKRERDEAKKRAQEAEDKLNQLNQDDARKNKDIDALEKSWKEKSDKEINEAKSEAGKYRDQLTNLLVRDQARSLAEEISTSPELILPHIERRLRAEFDGETPKTRVLDIDGNASAATMEDLKKELLATEKFKPILIASKASGGGAGPGGNGGGAPTGKKPEEYSEAERVALYNTNPVKFKELFPQPA